MIHKVLSEKLLGNSDYREELVVKDEGKFESLLCILEIC